MIASTPLFEDSPREEVEEAEEVEEVELVVVGEGGGGVEKCLTQDWRRLDCSVISWSRLRMDPLTRLASCSSEAVMVRRREYSEGGAESCPGACGAAANLLRV